MLNETNLIIWLLYLVSSSKLSSDMNSGCSSCLFFSKFQIKVFIFLTVCKPNCRVHIIEELERTNDHKLTNTSKRSAKSDVGNTCTNGTDRHGTYIQVKRRAESSKAALNHILINLFILSGHVSPLSQSLTQRSHCEMSNLFWPENRKERKNQDVIMKTDTHSKTARHDSEDTTCSLTVGWFVEANLICQLPIRSPKDFPNVPLESFKVFS